MAIIHSVIIKDDEALHALMEKRPVALDFEFYRAHETLTPYAVGFAFERNGAMSC